MKTTKACNFDKKETPMQVFSYEFSKTFKNTHFIEHLWVTASVSSNAYHHLMKASNWLSL